MKADMLEGQFWYPHLRHWDRVGTATLAELAGATGAAVTGPPYVAVVPAAARQPTALLPLRLRTHLSPHDVIVSKLGVGRSCKLGKIV
jgi:hypothetical protein